MKYRALKLAGFAIKSAVLIKSYRNQIGIVSDQVFCFVFFDARNNYYLGSIIITTKGKTCKMPKAIQDKLARYLGRYFTIQFEKGSKHNFYKIKNYLITRNNRLNGFQFIAKGLREIPTARNLGEVKSVNRLTVNQWVNKKNA